MSNQHSVTKRHRRPKSGKWLVSDTIKRNLRQMAFASFGFAVLLAILAFAQQQAQPL
jgi:hypothetical protein